MNKCRVKLVTTNNEKKNWIASNLSPLENTNEVIQGDLFIGD